MAETWNKKEREKKKQQSKKEKEELSEAEKKVITQQKNVDELKQQVSILKVSAGDMSEVDKKEFEKRINGYLKEIDRCIAMLGQ